MKSAVEKILRDCGIFEFGFAAFEGDDLLQCRATARIPQNAKTVICCVFPYLVKTKESNICKYAVVADYHIVINNILKQACQSLQEAFPHKFESFVDNSPIKEVKTAQKAGLGFAGKNGMLITEKYGSYCFVGEIVTDMELEQSTPNTERCLGCNACIKSCPGGAISENGVDPVKCVSGISQKKGELTGEEENLVKSTGLVWGCDICGDCCPHNKNAEETYIKEFYEDIMANVNLQSAKELCKTRAFGFRGSKVIERNLKLFTK